jgi:hypothetical protein
METSLKDAGEIERESERSHSNEDRSGKESEFWSNSPGAVVLSAAKDLRLFVEKFESMDKWHRISASITLRLIEARELSATGLNRYRWRKSSKLPVCPVNRALSKKGHDERFAKIARITHSAITIASTIRRRIVRGHQKKTMTSMNAAQRYGLFDFASSVIDSPVYQPKMLNFRVAGELS